MTTVPEERHIYRMAPLIRFTLLALYGALVLPLPLIAPAELRTPLWIAFWLGLALVVALTSEQVVVEAEGLRVAHPAWCSWLLKRGWHLPWQQVAALIPVATSQGGRVFYVRAKDEARAYLLPQRVERFEDFLQRFTVLSGVSTETVGRISPAWTYQLLAVLSGLLLLGEGVTLAVRG